jgi:radical SAM protein with 4Fe4S-binding SPASM domain
MIIKQFHQFVFVARGPKNSCIADLMKGTMFQVENHFMDAFENREYDSIAEFISSLEEEGLIIDIEESRWIPRVDFYTAITEDDYPYQIDFEDGVDIGLLRRKLSGLSVSAIHYYGAGDPPQILEHIPTKKIAKDIDQCRERTTINGQFSKTTRHYIQYNHHYNSCWGKRLAITCENLVHPCIYSDIVLGDFVNENLYDIIQKADNYWKITKDKIDKCKVCEFRYSCPDCRVLAIQKGGQLTAANPFCSYDPCKGTVT